MLNLWNNLLTKKDEYIAHLFCCKDMLQKYQPLKLKFKKKLYIFKISIFKKESEDMSDVESIKSLDELKKAQAAAQSQGTQITNYQDWYDTMQSLQEAGVESTGSYSGDKAKLQEVEDTIQKFMEQQKSEQTQKQTQSQTKQVENNSKSDNEQALKANMANGVSSTIMSDYMKYYHLLS